MTTEKECNAQGWAKLGSKIINQSASKKLVTPCALKQNYFFSTPKDNWVTYVFELKKEAHELKQLATEQATPLAPHHSPASLVTPPIFEPVNFQVEKFYGPRGDLLKIQALFSHFRQDI